MDFDSYICRLPAKFGRKLLNSKNNLSNLDSLGY